MKLIKRSVSVFLAVLMAFGSFAMLANAAATYNWELDTKFYRQARNAAGEIIEGSWVETENAMKGEKLKARVFMKTDFALGASDFFFFYPTAFLTHDMTSYTKTGNSYELLTNTSDGKTIPANTYKGAFTSATDVSGQFDNMVYEGYLDESDIEGKGWVAVSLYGAAKAIVLDGSEWLFEFNFTVNQTISEGDEGQFYLSTECVSDYDNWMAFTVIAAQPNGTSYSTGLDLSCDVDMGTFAYTLNDTDTDSTVDLYSSLTFDTGDGAFEDGTTTFAVENYEVRATTPIDEFPGAPVREGYTFKGWVDKEKYDNKTYTEADIISDKYVLDGNFNYQHDEVDLIAVYEAPNFVTVNVHYYDVVTGEDVVNSETTYGTVTGNYVEIIDDEAIPEEVPETTTYIAFSKLPKIDHYKFDTANASNVLTVSAAEAEGKSELDVYYIPESYTVTFDPANGDEVTTSDPITYYTEVTAPAAPAKDGYKFVKWVGDDGSELVPAEDGTPAKFNIAGNVTYTAQYESAETTVAIKVKYNDLANGGAEKIVPHDTVETIAGYTVALADAAGDAENTTYYLISDLPEIAHYEYDAAATTTTVTATADGTAELIVAYKPVQYTVTFDPANGEEAATETENYYTEITAPANPAKAGATFTKWVGSDGTELAAAAEGGASAKFNLTGNVTYTAQYEDVIYNTTLSFTGEEDVDYPADAVLPTVASGKMGDEIVLTDPAPVTGWTFNGWDAPVGAVEQDGKYYYGTSDVTVTGSWTHEEYTITFWLDAAKTIEYDSQTHFYGDVLEFPDAPPADLMPAGKEFVEWDSDLVTMPAEDVDVVAATNDIVYTVVVNVLGEEVTSFELNYGDEITADDLAEFEEIEGYTFNFWKVANKEIPLPYTVTRNAAIVADVTINTWDLYFWTDEADYNAFMGGDTTVVPVKLVEDVEYEENISNQTPVAPTKEGYAFRYWDMEPTTMEDNDMHFYGIWKTEEYNVIWDNDGATVEHSYKYNESLVIPEVSKVGYEFKGWSGLEEGTTKMPDIGNDGDSVTYTAVWEANSYDAIFYLDAEKTQEHATVSTKFDADIVAPADPEKDGYDFAGWSPAVGKMDSVDGKEFVATWTAKGDTPYTVNVYTMGTDGEYGAADVKNLTAATDSSVSYTPEIANGFELNANSKTEGTVTADGNLVLNIWIDRQTFTLTTVVDGESTDTPYLYGAAVAVETPSKVGHSFAWDKAVPATMPAENVTLNGTFTALEYDLIYMVDGQQYSSEKVTFGTEVTVIDALTKEGYTFSGWDKTGTFTMPAETVTISGTWTVKTHDVIYMVDGVEYDRVEDVAYGTPVTVIATPVEEGKTFTAWDKTDFTMPDEDVVISCTSTVNTHDVIYMVDGVEYDRIKDVAYGTPVTVIATPVEEGKTFTAWDKTDFTMPDEDVVISCTSTVNTHDVIYMVDGVEYDRIEDVAYGTPVTVLADLVEAGKVFSGWTIDGVKAEDFAMPDSDVTIVGSWTTNTYTVTYYMGKADATVHYTYTGAYGAEYNVPVDPEKEGHKFLGWANVADNAAAGLPEAGVITTVPLNGAEYYATWETLSYKLVYAAGTDATFSDGATTKTFDVPYGTAQADWDVPTEALTKPGYTFGGWDLSGAPATMGAAPVRVNAIWNPVDYTVTWINSEAEVVEHYIYGEEILAADEGVREGWTFTGWLEADGVTYFAEGDVMGEKSLVYTAQWEGNDGIEYTVYRYFEKADKSGWMDAAEAEALTGKAGSTVLTGKAGTDAEVDAAAEAVDGFTIDEAISVLTKEIAGDGSTVLEIYYKRDTVNVTVKDPSGETYIDDEFTYGESIELEDPEKEGFTFVEWRDGEGNKVTFPMTAPADDIVIKPVWTTNTYTITFEDYDGSVIEAAKTVEYGSTIVAPADPERDGYKFAYWQDKDTGAVMPATMPAKNATYVAYYTAGEDTTYYIEVYMMDTNGDYTMASQTIATGTTGDPISITPGTVEGCTYDADMSVLTGVITADGKAVLKIYYARGLYNVTFKSGEGVFADDATVVGPTEVYFGAAIPVPEDPTREGYEFTGWDTEVPATMPADNLTFNATWAEAEYTITYIVNDKKTVETYKFGEAVEAPADPLIAGMTFMGWDTEIPATMPANDMIIIAVFEISVYQVTYIADGVVFQQYSVAHGDEIPVPAEEPTKKYHTFKGWTEIPATMPAQDIEITAIFERVPVKLIPMEGSTTVIDDETMAIYGLQRYATEEILRESYLDVEGDGYFTVTPSKKTACGTGTVIELYDNVTGELLETYTIVIFGDLNGDSNINNSDYSIAQAEVDWFTAWSDPSSSEYNVYKTMAADFDGDGMIGRNEAASINRFVLGSVDIDQTTGDIVPVV